MHIRLNGEPYECPEALTITALLGQLGVEGNRVAVELNLGIVPKIEYATTVLKENDHVEVVHFVGGGAV